MDLGNPQNGFEMILQLVNVEEIPMKICIMNLPFPFLVHVLMLLF